MLGPLLPGLPPKNSIRCGSTHTTRKTIRKDKAIGAKGVTWGRRTEIHGEIFGRRSSAPRGAGALLLTECRQRLVSRAVGPSHSSPLYRTPATYRGRVLLSCWMNGGSSLLSNVFGKMFFC